MLQLSQSYEQQDFSSSNQIFHLIEPTIKQI